MPVRLAIHGAAGRMGQRLIALSHADPDLELVAALEAAGHPDVGRDVGQLAGTGDLGLLVTQEIDSDARIDVIIDFSVPEAAIALLQTCQQHEIALVLATTGLDAAQRELVAGAGHLIPLLWAPNMSLAVNLLMHLAGQTADALKQHPSGVDVEILERHHRYKEDAPSGTALQFGEIIARRMGQTIQQHGRQGRPGSRSRDEIGYHAIRTGDNPGEHTIVFGLLGETIELTVRATNRDCYAYGALSAAKFLASQKPGLYSMEDLLGFKH